VDVIALLVMANLVAELFDAVDGFQSLRPKAQSLPVP